MITVNDCILLLSALKEQGVNVSKQIKETVASPSPSIEILKFINDNRQLDLSMFYEKIRKSYNSGHSKLYINIMKELDENSTYDVLITLNAYALQILLFGNDLEDKQLFFKFSRLEEVYRCLHHYSKTYDISPSIQLLRLIKADIKCLEQCYRIDEK